MTDNESTNSSSRTGLSRRAVLGTAFGVPVVGSLGVGVASSVAEMTDSGVTTVPSVDGSDVAAEVTVDFPSRHHPLSNEMFTSLTLDPELLSTLDRSVGDQIRLRRGDECAVYTVRAALQESDDDVVSINRRARARLDLDNTVWTKVGDFGKGCPELLGVSDLTTEVFDAVADPVVVSDLSVVEARREGELVEQLDGDGRQLAILAPHGGHIEPHTDDQAESLATATGSEYTLWRAKGYRPEGGAFLRWHVPSTQISGTSFPALGSVLDGSFEHAVSFHGICTNRIQIGGAAPDGVKRTLRDAIEERLPNRAPPVTVASGRYESTAPSVLVNRLSDNGIWLGQPQEVRARHRDAVVNAVADAYDQLLG